jgi:tRNA threonylcarbamoyladenosine biosynthesis protein TsaE
LRLYHLDLYRLAGTLSEIDSLGLEEMLAQQNAVVLIEWAERLSDYDIPGAYCVSITDENDDEREITIAQSSG